MEEIKKAVRLNRMGKKVQDQFYVDDDVNVPDAKSDVSRIILSNGYVRIEDIKMVESYARVIGKVGYQILYAADGEEQRLSSVQGKLPFEEMVYMEEEPEGQIFVKSSNAEIAATMIHSRKLNLKATVELELGSEKEEEAQLTLDVEDAASLYKKYESRELLELHMSGKDTYRIKEEMRIPGTKENIGTLLWTEIASRKLDTRLETDELILRGELQVFCLYESLEGKIDWVEQTVPYEGRVKCPGADDTMYHHLYAELTDENIDVRLDEDGEMRIFGIEATLDMRIAIYREEKTNILEDVYSLQTVCTPEVSEMTFETLVMQNHSKCKLTEQLNLPELRNGILQICHSSGYLQTEHMEIVPEGIRVEGILNVSFLYVKADDTVPYDVWQGMVPFSHIIESNTAEPDMKFDITSSLEQLTISLLGSDEVEVKAVLAFHNFLRKPFSIANIEHIAAEPIDPAKLEQSPGIVGYIVQKGDRLWDLAKKYNTTTEGIMEINHLASEELKQGDRILIFKENMSIL